MADRTGTMQVEEALLSPLPSEVLLRWARTGRLREVLPDLEALRGVEQLPAHRDDAFVHTLKVVDAIEPIALRRWAALLHDIGKAPTFIATPEGRSRFFEHDKVGAAMVPEVMELAGAPPDLVGPVAGLVSLHMRPISYEDKWSDSAVRRLFESAVAAAGDEGWNHLLALVRADLRGYRPEPIERGLWVLDQLERRCARIYSAEDLSQTPASPLDGAEIVALAGREPGPWVAEAKVFLEESVTARRIHSADKSGATRLLNEWLRANKDATRHR